jgi:dTDP-4-amino-4,6-dideoxygalactose transaminase
MEEQSFILGAEVEALEKEIAAYCGAAHGVGVSSGTDALLLSLQALGLKPGDEVVTTPFTFVATFNAIVRAGAVPVFADIDRATFNLDVRRLEAALTPRTRAFMPVHLFGLMCPMAEIRELARARGVHVVEDAAQAIGAKRGDDSAAASGDFGCLSFFPSKNLGGAGDGGMILTNDAARANLARLLRNQGQQPKHHARVVSGNHRLDALQAAILRVKLRHLDAWTERRRRNAARYAALFRGVGEENVTLPSCPPSARHVWNQFVIRARRRDELEIALREAGVQTQVYYPVPAHRQEALARLGFSYSDFPEAEAACAECLALPVHPELEDGAQEHVARTIAAFYAR